MGRFPIDLTGKRFGFLTVEAQDGNHELCSAKYWVCKCDCGNTIVVKGSSLTKKRISDCGCKSYDVFLPMRRNGIIRRGNNRNQNKDDNRPKRRECSIKKINDDGCVFLLEAFLANLAEDYYSAYCYHIENLKDAKSGVTYRKLRNFITSDYFNALTGLDGKAIVKGLDVVNERRYAEGERIDSASA